MGMTFIPELGNVIFLENGDQPSPLLPKKIFWTSGWSREGFDRIRTWHLEAYEGSAIIEFPTEHSYRECEKFLKKNGYKTIDEEEKVWER